VLSAGKEKRMHKTISLLPFLESEREGFSLEIPTSDPVDDEFHGDFRPFQVADSGQCFSMIVKANLASSHAGPCLPLFLLIQRDHYPVSSSGLRTYTNADMDRIWLDTIQSCSADKTVFRHPDPACFKPLFFCRHKTLFFHPPCPECGGLLDLCTDDRLLKQAALFSYHASLKRYLFCPRCQAGEGKNIFYQYSRYPEDRVFVKDRFDLVRDFKRLRSASSESFPCLFCPEHAQCHITGEKALSRISVFSFYPFYMLVFDAASVKGVDFIPLLSGARMEDIPALADTVSGAALDANRISHGGTGFFFEKENRFFLEVLYLKLSFIEKFARILKQKVHDNIRSIVNLSAHSIWLTPLNQGSMLPFFWGFDLNIIDLLSNRHEDGGDVFPAGNKNIDFLAGLWFYTFLVNRNQGQNEVFAGLRQLSGNNSLEAYFSDYTRLVQAYPFLAVENIFWHPENGTVSEQWHPLWLKTLAAGIRFFQPHSQDLKTEVDTLLQDLDGLKQKVKISLFATRSAADEPLAAPKAQLTDHEVPPGTQARKQAVRSLLLQLKDKWQAEEMKGDSDPGGQEEDVLETIVLSSPDKNVPESAPDPGADFEDLEKTVVLTPDHMTGSDGGAEQNDRFFGENDDLDKTVVISPKK
jgi:hypothetical protein